MNVDVWLQPMHDNYDLRQEQLNKASIMSSKKFMESLLDMFKVHVVGTYTIVLLKYVCLSLFANCRTQLMFNHLGRCLELFVSNVIPSSHMVASQFDLAIVL